MENKKNRTAFVMKVDENGFLREESDFDNSVKWDSPAVVKAVRNKINRSQ